MVINFSANYIPFLRNQITNPDTRYWATGNHIVGTYDDETATGAMLQMMSIADPKSGLPTVLQFRLKTVSELMATSDIGVSTDDPIAVNSKSGTEAFITF